MAVYKNTTRADSSKYILKNFVPWTSTFITNENDCSLLMIDIRKFFYPNVSLLKETGLQLAWAFKSFSRVFIASRLSDTYISTSKSSTSKSSFHPFDSWSKLWQKPKLIGQCNLVLFETFLKIRQKNLQ